MNLKKGQKNPPQKKTMKKRQEEGLSSARAMVWLNVSRECELLTLTVTSYTEKKRNRLDYMNLWFQRVFKEER